MDLDQAIRTHAEWKMKFRSAIAKQERMDAAAISKDDCCTLGLWLHRDGKARWGATPEFQRAIDKHKDFHVEAGRVAGLINASKYGAAEAALNHGTSYTQASGEVGVALIALKKLAGL
jgi:hypothetical protein